MARRAFVEDLRLNKFGIGNSEANPLAQDFHEAIRNLSEGLYQKDIHFLLEILQNAEDNSYPESFPPSLEIFMTDKDITATGAASTLVFFNNEVGFSEKNIEAICSIGRSTKKEKTEGYIGEKGIGFKSVFLVSGRPHVISNGFRIRFHDEPDNEAGLGYVVPEWTEKPTDEDLARIYGSRDVPNTVLVLPLRQEKIEGVGNQLLQISPESLLFLSKLSKLKIGRHLNLWRTVEAAATQKGNCKSFTTILSAESGGQIRESSYYMFVEKFRVWDWCKVASRDGVDEWSITLAFPFEDVVWPSGVGSTDGNVFSFLPTEVQSRFPFLINSDFILTSSREAISWENSWNQGILNLIPQVFCNAFESLVKKEAFGGAQSSMGTAHMYRYIPTARSCPGLERARLEIIDDLKQRQIMLCASEVLDDNVTRFCLVSDARTVIRSFRDILKEALRLNIGSPLVGRKLRIVNRFVQEGQTSALSALSVQRMSVTEYIDLMPLWWIKKLPDKLYAKLLSFIAFDLQICDKHDMVCKTFKFLKYKDCSSGEIKYASILDRQNAANEPICLSSDQTSSWSSLWADELYEWITFHVMTEEFLFVVKDSTYSTLLTWLKAKLNVISITPQSIVEKLVGVAKQNPSRRLALISMHFFYDMEQKGLALNSLKGKIPLLDCLGSLHLDTSKNIFLPPSVSKWPVLMQPTTWADFVTKLSDQYLEKQCKMVDLSSKKMKKSFILFLQRNLDAIDILELYPLNQSFPTEELAKKEAGLLFLDWIKNALEKLGQLPTEFLKSIASSCWVSTKHGHRSPSQSFLLVPEIMKYFASGDLPFVDTSYYGGVSQRRLDWEAIGVNTKLSEEECYKAVIEHFQFLMKRPASEMCADKATRFYTYFSSFKTSLKLEKSLPSIWIPGTHANSSPCWAATEKCLICDEDGLFETKYPILEKFYDSKTITSFFHRLGVPNKPGMGHYCNLWLDWTKESKNIADQECLKTWTVLAGEDRANFRKGPIWSKFLKDASIPSTLIGKECITLLRPSKTLVPDDMEMEHLFRNSVHPPPMVWYPGSEVCNLSDLFSIFISMGAQSLAKCVKSEIDMSSAATSKIVSSDILWPIQCLVSPDLSKLVMGFISKELPAHERKKSLFPLLTAKEMTMNEGLTIKHSLHIGEQTFTTSSKVLVFWERSSNTIYHLERGQLQNSASRMMFNHQLAKAISHGLLSERREIAQDLEKNLCAATLCDLDSSTVDLMLRSKNIRVCEEDMSFIQSKRLEDAPSTKLEEDNATSIPLETLTKRTTDADGEVNAARQSVGQSRSGSSCKTSRQEEDPQMCIDLESLVTQLNISDRPVASTFSTPRMGGRGPITQQQGHATIFRRGSNKGSTTNVLEEGHRKELLHEIRGALLGEGTKTPIAIDMSVEPALGWCKTQLMSVRHFLGYPPEPGSVKRGMRMMDLQGEPFNLDKYLFLAFANPMISTNSQFSTMHERFTTLGHACLNMWITCELIDKHPNENMRGIIGKKEKLMSRALCSEFMRASQLKMSIVGADCCDDSKTLSDVFMAIMGVGYLCYDCGLDEVRRLYLEVFVESLEACEAAN